VDVDIVLFCTGTSMECCLERIWEVDKVRKVWIYNLEVDVQ